MKKRNLKNNNYPFIKVILFLVTFAVMFLSIGYSQFSATGSIENIMASFKLKTDARITGIMVSTTSNGGISNAADYNYDNIYGSISLPNADSTVTYKVDATVFLGSEMSISSITGLDSNLEYELTDYTLDSILCNQNNECNYGATKSFYITIKYKNGGYNSSNTTFPYVLNFTFEQASFVARIGNTRYETLQKAVDDVPSNNVETTVVLLKNTSEVITINNGQNVALDLQNNIISNNGSNPVIWNYGSLKLTNGTITSNTGYSAVNNEATGRLTMTGGNIIATGTRQAIYNNGGTAEISGTAYLSTTSNQRGAIQNLANGTVVIKGGTIVATRYSSIKNDANLTIGVKDGVVNKNTPVIQGSINGITSTVNYNFYDGIIKGITAAVDDENDIVDIETGMELLHSTETIGGSAYKTITLGDVVTVTFDANGGTVSETERELERGSVIGNLPTPTWTNYEFLGWFTDPDNGTEVTETEVVNSDIDLYAHWISISEIYKASLDGVEYNTIQAAIAAVPSNNTQKTITILRDTRENLTIAAGKNIVLNLQGHTIGNNGVSPVISNKGTLSIANGTITSNTTQGAVNNESSGKLYMSSGSIVATGTRQAIYNNGGRVEISGTSSLSATTTERGTLQNLANGTVVITGGTITSTGFSAIVNASGTITIGDKDGVINNSSPSIQGLTYGIDNTSKFNFYDGILKGKTAAINGNINDIEQNSQLVNSTEIIGGDTYYTSYLQ